MSEAEFPGPALAPLTLQIGGQTIAGYQSQGTGRPILLVHGNSSSSRIWQKQLQGPLGSKYRLIAIDLPGHGASSPPPNPEQDYSGPGYAASSLRPPVRLGLRMRWWSAGASAAMPFSMPRPRCRQPG
jgi:pimeloyl-ACP methyl ester carboxylesterase